MQGYHFPPPEAQPAYGGYSNPQLLAPQQWPPQGEPQPYEVNYQPYGADHGGFPHGGHGQHQGYADSDADFADGYYEDEEPRRGKRWLLIAAALVGAIGVGGALAYTYRSIVAPKSRLVAAKTEPGAKIKVLAERPPMKPVEETPPKATEPPASDDTSGDQGARKVKLIPVGPPPVSVPGIILYKPPEGSQPPATPVKEKAPPAPAAKETADDVESPPSSRLAVAKPPPQAKDETKDKDDEEEAPVTPPPAPSKHKKVAIATPPPAPKASTGSGYFVAVLKSAKTHMDAMTFYADMQQKHPDVLGATSFEVQEADLGPKGVWHRVVVGPPGSRNWASGVCSQLKAAGYVGCWVKEY